MANIEDLWARFSLTEEEEQGANVPRKKDVAIVRLAAKIFTKRVVNAEAVGRTFKPLWKPIGEMKIRDIRGNILLFEFDDAMDLERVLEFEPWSYDKSIVVLQRAVDAESAPSLNFDSVTFWVQLHNVPDKCLTQATGEVVGNNIGTLVQAADPEDDGEGGELLRIRVKMDITKALPRCCKLWSEGEHVGWALLKFERLPNFCYWCGRLTHSERDCEVWLKGKGSLKKDEQQYGEWLRANPLRQSRKTIVVEPGTSRGAKSWKKGPAIGKNQPTHTSSSNWEGSVSSYGKYDGTDRDVIEVISMEAEPTGGVFSNHAKSLSDFHIRHNVSSENLNKGIEEVRDPQPSHMPMQNSNKLNEVGTTFSQGQHDMFSFTAMQAPLSDITNQAVTQPLNNAKKKMGETVA